jgi:2,4-diketo-3-deoxy-L-fuconate hydrolase
MNRRVQLYAAVSLLALTLSVVSSCTSDKKNIIIQSENLDDASLIESLAIAPPEKALTFARTQNSLIGVQSYSNGIVSGVDLSLLYGISDPIELFQREGYQHLMRTLSLPADISVSLEDLIIPVTLSSHHIAAAGNFPEHAEEAGIRNEPYLFAKRVEPSQSRTTLSVGQALLDYEVELAWVTLYPLEENDRMPDFMGMIAVNDFTDRAELLHSIDPYDVESGQGFSHGKSFPGYLPVGELFVIPADYHEYASQRVLKLFVNGSLRQNSVVSAASWDIERIVQEAREKRDYIWEEPGGNVSLFPSNPGEIPERTLILSGTPAGVVFNEITVAQKAAGFFQFVFFGWRKSIAQHSIDNYIQWARREGIYLNPGDRVEIYIDGLGTIATQIIH